jgi:DNA polymerase-1
MLVIDDMIESIEEISATAHDVARINSVEKLYPAERQSSKTPTFALTYQGTTHTLIKKSGFPEAVAQQIYDRFHNFYRVSDAWVASRLDMASRVGYVTVAFGLRLRTPLLQQVVRGTSRTPREAEAEGRSAGNALGQSYCLLNTRAGVEFNAKVRRSKHRLDIRPCAQIHDAQYFLIRDTPEPVLFTNEHLVKAVQWQEDPLIWHDKVKITGELSIFYPNWAWEMGIENDATEADLAEAAAKHLTKLEADLGPLL